MAIVFLASGGLIAVSSFIFAVLNMTSGGDLDDGMFRRHGLAMIGFLIGGVLLSIGMFLGGWQLFQMLLERL